MAKNYIDKLSEETQKGMLETDIEQVHKAEKPFILP